MHNEKLSKYRAKRDFELTKEPSGDKKLKASNRRRFVRPACTTTSASNWTAY
jgi:bifunctional non-homologous end joining protein LigD